MPQPADLVLLRMIFDLRDDSNAPQEIAEFGIWGRADATPPAPSDWDPYLAALATKAADSWSTDIDPTHYSHGAALKEASATRAGADGKTLNEQIAVPATPWQGDATAHSLPWSSSLVISLYTYTPGTFIAHAGRRRGRVYPPPPNVSILETTNQGEVHSDTALAIMTDFSGWLHGVKHGGYPSPAVAWLPGVRSLAAANWNELTDLAIDTKIDTQRRREKNQTTVRQSMSFPL